jgi:hypothetical protein
VKSLLIEARSAKKPKKIPEAVNICIDQAASFFNIE